MPPLVPGAAALAARPSTAFAERRVVIPSDHSCPYVRAEWESALVLVERGLLEVEALDGSRARFSAGSALWLADLPVRALHAPGPEPAVLVALVRRAPPFSSPHP